MPTIDSSDYKLIVLGDAGVGKTSFLNRYATLQFDEARKPTVGVEVLETKYKYGSEVVSVSLYDPVGQERFRSLLNMFYRNVDICFIMFDLTNYHSFQNAYYWYNQFKTKNNSSCKDEFIILIGNKFDLEANREVTQEDIKSLLKCMTVPRYFECSVKTDPKIKQFVDSKILELVKASHSNLIVAPRRERKPNHSFVLAPKLRRRTKQNCNC
mmetsp:Transcript_10175/g.11089  ORF Transcript_10175/g.11089 Transcript_10175/m.11089 type:complete len:212 (-) Transcript_10175:342-977(-)